MLTMPCYTCISVKKSQIVNSGCSPTVIRTANVLLFSPGPEAADDVDEVDITDMVHDIGADVDVDEAEAIVGQVVHQLKEVSREDLKDPLLVATQSNLIQLASLRPFTSCKTCDKALVIKPKINGSGLILKWVSTNRKQHNTDPMEHKYISVLYQSVKCK